MSHLRLEAEFAAALVEPSAPPPAWALSPRGDVDARRFAVYRNNVHVGLVGALRSTFPVTARLVGEEFFTAMARVFAGNEKPTSPLLAQYGRTFPRFIATFEPARSVPYLADVAALEVAWLDAYHAADRPALDLAGLSAVPPEDLLSISFDPHPATRLLAARYPIGSIWSHNQSSDPGPLRATGPEAVLLTRPVVDVMVRVVPAADHAFCAALLAGNRIEDAAAAAVRHSPSFDAGAALVGLVGAGVFAGIHSRGSLA